MAKTAKAKVEVLDPIVEQAVAIVATESLGLIAWLQGLVPFFRGARELEVAAVARHERVKLLTVPTTQVEDAAIRQEAIDARAARLAAGEYWEAVTGALSRVHRLTTTARARTVEPNKAAEDRATALHNAYVTAETQRAAREAEALRQAEERRAQAEREADLARHEAAAVAAEEASPDLSERERRFVADYMARGNASKAAFLAGYKNPEVMAPRLLASDKIRAAIEAIRTAEQIRKQAAIVKDLPVYVDEQKLEEAATPQLNKGDRYRWSATVVDLDKFRDAAFEGGYGIPRDCFMVDAAAVNAYARSLEQNIERWPGVKATKKTTVL